MHDGASYQIHGTYPKRRALKNDVDSTHRCPKRSRQRRVMTEKHRNIHSSLRGDTTDLLCGETRGALWQNRMLVVARQDLCGAKEQGRRPSAASTKGGGRLRRRPPFVVPLFLATTEVLLVLPQRTSCFATAHLSSCHTRDPSCKSACRELVKPQTPDCSSSEGYSNPLKKVIKFNCVNNLPLGLN